MPNLEVYNQYPEESEVSYTFTRNKSHFFYQFI